MEQDKQKSEPKMPTTSSQKEVLLGKIAISRGFITPVQLKRVLEYQSKIAPHVRIGDILLQWKLVTPAQWSEVLATHQRMLREPAEYTDALLQDTLLGQIAVRRGWINAEQLNECLRLQGLHEAKGRDVRLGEILIQKRYLSAEQLRHILATQEKVLMKCPGCGQQYNIVRPQQGYVYRCKACNLPLAAPPTLDTPGAEGSWFVEAGDLTAVAEEVSPRLQPRKMASPLRYRAYRGRRRPLHSPSTRPYFVAAATSLCVVALLVYVLLYKEPLSESQPGKLSNGDQQLVAPEDRAPTTVKIDPLEKQWQLLSELKPRTRKEAQQLLTQLNSFEKAAQGTKYLEQATALRKQIEQEFGLGERPAADWWDRALATVRASLLGRDFALALRELDRLAATPEVQDNIERMHEIADLRRQVIEENRQFFNDVKLKIEAMRQRGERSNVEKLLQPILSYSIPEIVEEAKALLAALSFDPLPPADTAITTPADRTAVSAWREAGERRVREAREQLAKNRAERAAREKEKQERLVDVTKKKPFNVQWDKDLVLRGCRIEKYDGHRVFLVSTTPELQMDLPLACLPLDTQYLLRKVSLDPTNPAYARDWFDLGRFLALKRMPKESIEAFKIAEKLDASFKKLLPDFEKIRKRPRLFNARHFSVSSSTVSISYDFNDPNEVLDFTPFGKDVVSSLKGALVLSGRGLAVASVKDIPFANRVRFEVVPGHFTNAWAYFGLQQMGKDGKRRFFGILYDADDAAWCFWERAEDSADSQGLSWQELSGRRGRFVLLLDGTTFYLVVGGTVLYRSRIPKIDEVFLFIGGIATREKISGWGEYIIELPDSEGNCYVSYEAINISGYVSSSWIGKVRSSEAALFERELEDGLKLKSEDLKRRLPQFFREKAWEKYPESSRQLFSETREAIHNFYDTMLASDYEKAISKAETAVRLAPGHPGVWYLRGILARGEGKDNVTEFFEKALKLDPHFFEARLAIAEELVSAGKFREAMSEVNEVLAASPDFEPALLLHGEILLYKRDFSGARDVFELTQVLNPSNTRIPRALRAVDKVKYGPSWKKSYIETTQYHHVKTDISEKKAKFYRDHLAAIWNEYVSGIGVPIPPNTRPIEVLVFNDPEQYQLYAELTLDDRVEFTLGYFHPLFWQILLFEDPDIQDTLRVLYHEGFHYYARLIFGELPIWVNEGLAEYFAGTTIENARVKSRHNILIAHVNNLLDAIESGWKPVPFSELALMSKMRFYGSEAPLLYAQAWAIVHYFLHGGNKELAWAFKKYLDLLKNGRTGRQAYAEAFASAPSWGAWEPTWLRYLHDMKKR